MDAPARHYETRGLTFPRIYPRPAVRVCAGVSRGAVSSSSASPSARQASHTTGHAPTPTPMAPLAMGPKYPVYALPTRMQFWEFFSLSARAGLNLWLYLTPLGVQLRHEHTNSGCSAGGYDRDRAEVRPAGREEGRREHDSRGA